MPSASNVIGTVLTMDTQDFVLGAHEARDLLKQLTKEFDASDAGMGRWQKSIEGLGKRMSFLEAKIKVEEALIKNYRNEIEKLSENYSQNESRIKSLEEGITNARIEINKYTTQLESCQEQLDKMWMSAEEANTPLNRLNNTIREQEEELATLLIRYKNLLLSSDASGNEISELEDKISRLNGELRENRNLLSQIDGSADALTALNLSLPKGFTVLGGIFSNLASDLIYNAISRIGDGLRNAVKVTVDWETAFTGVRRTVEATEDEFIRLEQSLIGIGGTVATPLPEIADIASLAGQMGIPVDQISEFTRVMIMLGDTTNISAEEAGDSLARLSNLLNLTTDDYERMGSALVELGNNFPTTESEIASMASRLGGTANMLDITAQDVLGLANAISAVGIEAEMGGNAVSKTLREMQIAVEQGTANLSVFADTAGVTSTEFQKIFSEDAMKALQMFINGLGDVATNGQSITQILNNVNVTEVRQVDVLTRLATNTDTLNHSLEVSRTAWDENTALVDEANKRYQSIESRIQMMKNAWSALSITLVNNFRPAIISSIDTIRNMAYSLNGQRGASDLLSTALVNLRASVNDYRTATELASTSTDALTRAMAQNRLEAMRESMRNVADIYRKSQTEIQTYESMAESVASRISTAYATSLTNNTNGIFDDETTQYLASLGFDINDTSTENILDMYSRLSTLESIPDEWVKTWLGEKRSDNSQAVELLINILKRAGSDVTKYENAIAQRDASMARVRLNQQALLEGYGDLYQMTDEAGNHFITWATFADDLDNETISLLQNVEHGIDAGNKQAENLIANLELTSDAYSSQIEELSQFRDGLELTDAKYWESNAIINALATNAKNNGIILSEEAQNASSILTGTIQNTAKTAQSIWDEFNKTRSNSIDLYRMLGIPLDQSQLNTITQNFMTEMYNFISDTESANNELVESIDKANEQKDSKRAEDLTNQKEANEAQIEEAKRFINEMKALYVNEGDTFESLMAQMNQEMSSSKQIASFLGIDIDDDTLKGFYQNWVTQFVRFAEEQRELADYFREQGLNDIAESYDQQAKMAENQAEILGQIYQSLGNDEEESFRSWGTRFFEDVLGLGGENSDNAIGRFGQGLEDFLDKFDQYFGQIGKSVLDTINMWFDAQLTAIDDEMNRVSEKLEEYQKMVDETRQINENNLRKQLEEGTIDEETYYRLSAKNKYDSEAKKQQAEEETANKQEELQRKRELIESKQFEAEKANKIAEVLMSVAQGIASAWSTGQIWYGAMMSAMLPAIGATQIGMISSQKYTPALATGGIVTAPTTALIGEAGKEAVLPLEQNTDWMDELAYRIGSIITSDRIRTAIDRTMNEDGRTVDETKNVQFTQIINSPKALSRKEIYRDTRRLVRMVDRRTS